MFNTIKKFIDRFLIEFDEWNYKFSDERKELARARLAMHQLHTEGKVRLSPYLNPDSRWYEQRP